MAGLFCVFAVLSPLILRGVAFLLMSTPGSPREAQTQMEELSASLHQFLPAHRDELEELRAAAQAGHELPDHTVQAILASPVEQADITHVYARNGEIQIWLDNSRYAGKLYTQVTLGSGPPPLSDGTAAEEGQTFWDLNDGASRGHYRYIEILEDSWYADYESITRG